ncbi:hypothetical protein CDAR_301881 [Caerostris darwini]|uniref:Uncharacterized protein n=1 Tax=Caerostris darwini TaxID=1538125 RepID=A0AAV4UGL5_9ARAC|nr:hypothetical protein CDAR_301881 [Caerostris darwini]
MVCTGFIINRPTPLNVLASVSRPRYIDYVLLSYVYLFRDGSFHLWDASEKHLFSRQHASKNKKTLIQAVADKKTVSTADE